MENVSLVRLYVMRAAYLLIFAGLAIFQWPRLLGHSGPWELWNSVGTCMLVTVSLLAALGIRYPLRMLPLFFFELLWKSIWLLTIALPAWRAGQVSAAIRESTFDCVFGLLILPLAIPWGYVLREFVRAPADRWHNERVSHGVAVVR